MATPGVAAAAPPVFTGSITCAISVTLRFKPALVNGGTANETVTLAANMGGCTGDVTQFGKTIQNAVVHATGTILGNDCGSYLTGGKALPPFNGNIKWIPAGVAPTIISYSGASLDADFNDAAISLSLPQPGGSGAATAGSFVGPISPLFTFGSADPVNILKKCQTKAGVASLTGFGGNVTIGT